MTTRLRPDLQNLLAERLHTTPEEITDFCQRQNIIEFALFGSVLRDDFGPSSDVDVLVTYAPDHHLRWQDWLAVKEELEQRFGRSVDVVEKPLLKNPYRRAEILQTQQVIYEFIR
jgi:predicted nucleotidyltransferase